MKPNPRNTPPDPTAMRLARLHLWQIQAVRDVAVVLSVVGIIYLGYQMSIVTVPLLLGLLLAYLLEPPIAWLARKRGRVFAASMALVVMGLIVVVPVGGAVVAGGVQGQRFLSGIDRDLTKFVDQLEKFLTYLERDSVKVIFEGGGISGVEPGDSKGGKPAEDDEEAEPEGAAVAAGEEGPEGESTDPSQPVPAEPRADEEPRQEGEGDNGEAPKEDEKEKEEDLTDEAGGEQTLVQRYASVARSWIRNNMKPVSADQVAQSAGSVFNVGWIVLAGAGAFVFKYLFLTPFFFFFWSIGFGQVQRFGAQLIPETKRAATLEIIHKMDRAIAAFIRGRFTIALILSVCYTVAYTLIGVPVPLIFGPVVGILSAVPYLPLIGWPATILAMAIDQAGSDDPSSWWWIVLAPTAVYFAFQTLDDYFLTPKIQGKNVGLSTPVILFAVIGAGALAGVYGVLIAIPIAACVKILITDVIFPRYKDWVEGRAADPLPLGDDPQP